jgi:hypothetical protein
MAIFVDVPMRAKRRPPVCRGFSGLQLVYFRHGDFDWNNGPTAAIGARNLGMNEQSVRATHWRSPRG